MISIDLSAVIFRSGIFKALCFDRVKERLTVRRAELPGTFSWQTFGWSSNRLNRCIILGASSRRYDVVEQRHILEALIHVILILLLFEHLLEEGVGITFTFLFDRYLSLDIILIRSLPWLHEPLVPTIMILLLSLRSLLWLLLVLMLTKIQWINVLLIIQNLMLRRDSIVRSPHSLLSCIISLISIFALAIV